MAAAARRGTRAWWHGLALCLPLLSLAATALTVVGSSRPAAAGARVLYAYAGDEIDHQGSGAGTMVVAADIFDGGCDKVGGTWHDLGYNVGDDRTCLRGTRGDVDHGASWLGGLAANGGPTQTMLPLKGNPALGAVPFGTTLTLGASRVILCPASDQRGGEERPRPAVRRRGGPGARRGRLAIGS